MASVCDNHDDVRSTDCPSLFHMTPAAWPANIATHIGRVTVYKTVYPTTFIILSRFFTMASPIDHGMIIATANIIRTKPIKQQNILVLTDDR